MDDMIFHCFDFGEISKEELEELLSLLEKKKNKDN